MKLRLKTLSVLVALFLFSIASAQTPPAEKKDGDLKFELFTIPFEGQNVSGELGIISSPYARSCWAIPIGQWAMSAVTFSSCFLCNGSRVAAAPPAAGLNLFVTASLCS